MHKRFDNKVALITGGARGIGMQIAQRLKSEGAKVYIFDNREIQLQQSMAALSIEGHCVDISDEDQVKAGIDQIVLDNQGRLDIMINSAGIIGDTSTKIVDFKTKIFDDVVKVNLKGAFLMTKHSLPAMIKANYGRIIHIASIAGKEGNPGMVAYASSKAGLIGLIKAVGKEYAETGITINGIAPAVIATDMNESTDKEMLDYMISKIPMKRLGTVDEVASMVCWLASEEASFNTAQVFDLSGGRATY